MNRAVALAILLTSSSALAQSQGWTANQDGNQFQCTDVSYLNVGTAVIGALPVEFTGPINGTQGVYISNSSAGSNAQADWVLEAATTDAFNTPPFLAGAVYGRGVTPPGGSPYFTAGSAVLSYAGQQNFDIDMGAQGGNPQLIFTNHAAAGGTTQEIIAQLTYLGDFSLPQSLAGSGTRCVQADNAGKLALAASACGSGSGSVTSVTGTAAQILCTPSSPNPVCSLIATAVTPGSYTYGSFTVDALGRLTAASSGTAPITSLTHDVTTSGSGAATANVVGIEDDAICRGDLLFANESAPSTPSAGDTRVWTDATAKNIFAKNDAGTVNHGAQTFTCSSHQFETALADTGASTCAALGSGDVTCASTPAYTGSATKAAGSCATKVVAIDESGGLNIPIGACTTDGQAFVKVAGSMTCRLPAGDLSNDYTAPTVVAIHDAGNIRHPAAGTWGTGELVQTDGSGNLVTLIGPGKVWVDGTDAANNAPDYLSSKIIASSTVSVTPSGSNDQTLTLSVPVAAVFTVTLPYSFQLFTILNTGEAVTGGISPNPTGAIGTVATEYPMLVASTSVELACNLMANHITGGTYTLQVAKNGADVIGASLSFTSGSTTGVHAQGATVSSPSTADTWGLDFSAVGTAANCGSGICPADMTCVVRLQP